MAVTLLLAFIGISFGRVTPSRRERRDNRAKRWWFGNGG
jgi:hypothetical protein